MKPKMGMTKDVLLDESLGERREKNTFGLGWKIAIVSTAIVLGLTVVTAAVLIALYHNYTSSSDLIKEYIATIHDNESKTKQTIHVSTREEKFTTNTGATVIFDFETGLMTFSLIVHRESCYLASFNKSDIKTPDEFKAQHTESEIDFMMGNFSTKSFQVTDISFSRDVLGPMAKVECSGRSINILQEGAGSEEGRNKRDLYWTITINLGIIQFQIGNKQ